jgi:hypothetical protein
VSRGKYDASENLLLRDSAIGVQVEGLPGEDGGNDATFRRFAMRGVPQLGEVKPQPLLPAKAGIQNLATS